MRLLGISGALRQGSTNSLLIRAGVERFGSAEFQMGNLHLPLYDGDLELAEGIPHAARELAEEVTRADAVILSTPEYNQSMSGVIKNAIDWISRVEGNPWESKPIAIMAASAGRSGGARAAYSLRLAMTPFQPLMVPAPEVLLPFARKAFDDDGALADEGVAKRLRIAMEKLRAAV